MILNLAGFIALLVFFAVSSSGETKSAVGIGTLTRKSRGGIVSIVLSQPRTAAGGDRNLMTSVRSQREVIWEE